MTLCSLKLCIHGSCYGTVCSLQLCTYGSCYGTFCSLKLCIHSSCSGHATLLFVFLKFCTHASCYAIVCSLELCTHASCCAIVTQYVLTGSRSSMVHGRSGGAALIKKGLKTCDDEFVSSWPEHPKMAVSCRRNDCFRSIACESGVNDLKNKNT